MAHPSVTERLARLAPDQRAAATAPTGPVLVVAPAGSGKTTTLVARVAWLVDGGVDPGSIAVVAFNKKAAEELTERLDAALAPLGAPPGAVRVRTFHALGREILRDAGVAVEPLIDRDELLRSLIPESTAADRARLDLAFSRFKLDLRVSADDVAGDPAPGPIARTFIAYEGAVRGSGGVDFDDLVVRAVRCLQDDPALLARWRRPGGNAPRGRGAGRRQAPARPRAPPRGTGERHLPRRGRRPVDLWLAPRRCPPDPRSRCVAARTPADRPRGELPLPANGRGTRRPARRTQR